MNTPNNKRRRASRERIERAFMELLQQDDIRHITVAQICQRAHLNRSTFYANYQDIYALADSILDDLEANLSNIYRDEIERSFNSNDYLKLFRHIYDNQLFYRTYFRLGGDERYRVQIYSSRLAQRDFDGRFIDYHIEFFRSGLTAVLKKWLEGGCRETPEEIDEIIHSEYQGRAEAPHEEAGAS